jgi:hypothetical protein
MILPRLSGAAITAAIAIGALSACGGSGSHSNATSSGQPPGVPSASSFPSPKGKTIAQLTRGLGPGPILAPTVEQFDPGTNRYGFALFTTARKLISGIPVALYVERSGTTKVAGPYVAREESMAVRPQFQSQTVKNDPEAARALYVTRLKLPLPGVYAVLAVAKLDGRLVATQPIGAKTLASDPVPNVGQPAPQIQTPTVASVHGNIASIDTRQPHDDMHQVNFADVYGKKPIVLVFSTPALCQSRVCGPVTDVAEEVEHEQKPGSVVFIHNEIYMDNQIKPGCLEGTRPLAQCYRPQFLAYHLQSEPWVFAIDRHGRVAARIEGAYSKSELEAAVHQALVH